VGIGQLFNWFEFNAPNSVAGRASALTGNPVFLGGLLAGGLPMAAACLRREGARWWAWLPIIGLFAGTANLTGSRIGLVMAVLLVLAALLTVPRGRAIAAVIAVAVGIGLSLAVPKDTASGGRLADSQGFSSRFDAWEAGTSGWLERPLIGYGPGR